MLKSNLYTYSLDRINKDSIINETVLISFKNVLGDFDNALDEIIETILNDSQYNPGNYILTIGHNSIKKSYKLIIKGGLSICSEIE